MSTSPATDLVARRREHRPIVSWLMVGLLLSFMIVNWADRTVLSLAAKPLIAELGLSPAQFGFIGSSFFFLYSLSAAVVGALADRISVRWLLIGLAVLWSLTQLPIVVFATSGVLLAGRVVLGAAEGPALPLANSVAFSWFPPSRRGLVASIIGSGTTLARVVAAPVLTLAVVSFGWRGAFVSVAAAGVLWAVLWALLGREGPYAQSRPASPTRSRQRRGTLRAALPYARLLRNRTFVAALLGTWALYGMVAVDLTWTPLYLQNELGYSAIATGNIFGAVSLAETALMVGGSWISDRLMSRGVRPRIARGLFPGAVVVVGGLLLVVLGLHAGIPALSVLLLVAGLGLATIALPLMYTVASNTAGEGQRSGALALFYGLQTTAGIVAPYLAGVLIEGGGYSRVYVVFGVAIALGGVILAVFTRPRGAAEVAAQ